MRLLLDVSDNFMERGPQRKYNFFLYLSLDPACLSVIVSHLASLELGFVLFLDLIRRCN